MSESKISAPGTNPDARPTKAPRPTWKPAGRVHASEQPFTYPLSREFVEPDWRRLPGYKNVTKEEWETALWQRRHTVKNLKELKDVFGGLIPDSLLASVERDIRERATMSILIPPHMLNTMDEKNLWSDPVRRYMLPAFDDRHPEWPSHPKASRDSLHESDMWAVEGLTRALAQELPRGMAAVPFNPGIIDTDMLRTAFGESASKYPPAAEWAEKAVPFLLQLNSRDNGKPATAPGA